VAGIVDDRVDTSCPMTLAMPASTEESEVTSSSTAFRSTPFSLEKAWTASTCALLRPSVSRIEA
jgi:hypothetical protein